MVYFKNGEWHIVTEKVLYKQDGKELENFVGQEGKEWWVDFEEKWEHTDIIEFIPVEPTQGQIDRLEEVNQLNVKEGYSAEISNYVENGEFPEGINHPLKSLQDAKRIEELENIIDILLGGENNE